MRYQNSVPAQEAQISFTEITEPVRIRHNRQGVPLIEAKNDTDAYFAWGYSHASERINYMEMMRLTAQGRMTELMGRSALDVDRFMRTLNFTKTATQLYAQSSPEAKSILQSYSNGVNAWLKANQTHLPMDLSQANYHPKPWQPIDSVLLFCLTNYGLSGNLHEEISSLILAQKIGSNNLAWLFPTYADEPLPFAEADKLKGLNLAQQPDLVALYHTQDALQQLNLANIVASNNWAIAPSIQRNNDNNNADNHQPPAHSLLANDAHLPIGLPSLWSFVQIKTPTQQLAGASVAGLPLVVIGSNGQLAWGMTMVMADTEDVFLEKLSMRDGKLHYLYQNQWLPVQEHAETFKMRTEPDAVESFYSTVHGPLLNRTLRNRSYPLQPIAFQSEYGIALQTLTPSAQDKSIDAQIGLTRASTVAQGLNEAQNIQSLSVNVLMADKDNIGWQLTGHYPVRKKGLGLLPSPGWTGEYDWQGEIQADARPHVLNPAAGWLATANNRIVPRESPAKFSNSYYHRERIERIGQLIDQRAAQARNQAGKFSFADMRAIQLDQVNLLAVKLQPYWNSSQLNTAINALPAEQKVQAQNARDYLATFDGKMDAKSPQAALFSLFIQQFTHRLFADELGDNTPAWQAMVEITTKSYSAQVDHLLGREDSPFWDNTQTPQVEYKADIIAQSLQSAFAQGSALLGADFSRWQWGQLHTYQWNSIPTQIAPTLPAKLQKSIQKLGPYLDRGPYPAGGDFNTINISSYAVGKNFDTTLIPSLRMIVDFNQSEPLWMVNNSGESSNPASSHYADQIKPWREGGYFNLPFTQKNLDAAYGDKAILLIPNTQPTELPNHQEKTNE